MIKIKLVCIESGIASIGFRKIAAVVKKSYPQTDVCYVPTDNLYSFATHFFPGKISGISDIDLSHIARYLAKADVVGFSSMTASSEFVQKLCHLIKKINPKVYLIWGGVHPTLYPNSSIKYADAICIGEGELPIIDFLESFKSYRDFSTDVPNFWFKKGSKIIKNKSLPLNSSSLLQTFPYSYNRLDTHIYDSKTGHFKILNKFDYVKYNGLLYRTVWTLGCPFNCAYCANDSFINLNSRYRLLRYPKVDYLIAEIKEVIKYNPFISTIAFYDDNLIALPLEVIREFCQKYQKSIHLPFVVFGFHPNLTNQAKVDLLCRAGMNRTRMGIQSGSPATLKFFNRYTTINSIVTSADILADAARKYRMIPPAFDIITDNPVETAADKLATLNLLYQIHRPYTLNIFSLRIFPRTQLFDYVQKHPDLKKYFKENSYLDTLPTFYNIALFILATAKPPRYIFNYLSKKAGDSSFHPILFFLIKIPYFAKRGFNHLFHFDFSTMTGVWIYYLWLIKTVF